MTLQLMDEQENTTTVLIKVIGVGGGGCNAVQQMMDFDLHGVELICANTDKQVLEKSAVQHKLQLGAKITRGMGAGSNPEIGRQAAEEDRERIQEILNGADMVFIAAGMGGGTGTGAAPVIANIAHDMGILTVAIITKPFSFEGAQRMQIADVGIEELKKEVDCLVVIPNDRVHAMMEEDTQLIDSFKSVDNVLKNAVHSIASVIQTVGVINTDLEDVKTIMKARGIAIMGIGEAEGENRAKIATDRAVSSPLLEDISIEHARGILVNVKASSKIKTSEYQKVGSTISEMVDRTQANIKIGLIIDEELGEKIRVTVIATGIYSKEEEPEEKKLIEVGTDGQREESKQPKFTMDGNFNIPSLLRKKL